MSDKSPIEWTDATWQIVTGCSVVSPGCTNCYAMRLAGTRLRNHPSRIDLTTMSKAGPVWNGKVRFNVGWLTQPLKWRRPRRIFVAAHGDLFHDVTQDWMLDQVFAVMALTPHHQYQVLTKRSARMLAYFAAPHPSGNVAAWQARVCAEIDAMVPERTDESRAAKDRVVAGPLPNVWLGVSVEDQARADERIPHLLATPAAVRWISAEPLLGPVTLSSAWHRLDWVVAGGESGPSARPMHPDWARELRDACRAARIAFFFKQWGAFAPRPVGRPGVEVEGMEGDLRMVRVGKKAAGALLDGREHREFPQ